MATKSSYFLAVLLIANPFMLVFFQNCTSNSPQRGIASYDDTQITNEGLAEPEASYRINKNLIIK